MYVLTDNDLIKDLTALNEAWRRPESFVLLPGKSGVSREWLDGALRQVPRELADHRVT
jgi:hypothetical protein